MHTCLDHDWRCQNRANLNILEQYATVEFIKLQKWSVQTILARYPDSII